ncbi:MAG: hypothetical protein ABR507_09170 [Actinomycetota bacterium]
MNSGLTVYPVWAWYGRFMGRWCDWCRETYCWDCGAPNTECAGECANTIPYDWGTQGIGTAAEHLHHPIRSATSRVSQSQEEVQILAS